MKKTIITLTILFVFAAGASAQIPQPFSLYGGGAVSLPASPDGFDALYKTGWHGMAGVGYKFAPKFQLVGKFEFHNFGVDFQGLPLGGGNEKFAMFGADARFSPSFPVVPLAPYIFGGAGMAHITWNEFTSDSDPLSAAALNAVLPESLNKMYWNFGAGFELKTGPAMSLFIQGRYVSVATEGESTTFIPFTVGLKFF